MKGKIASGQLCTVEPVDPVTLAVGDIVLCRVRGAEYLHFGNNRGRINAWIGADGVLGRCTRVGD